MSDGCLYLKTGGGSSRLFATCDGRHGGLIAKRKIDREEEKTEIAEKYRRNGSAEERGELEGVYGGNDEGNEDR